MRLTSVLTSAALAACTAAAGLAQAPDIVSPSVLAHAHHIHFHQTPHDLTNGQAHSRFGVSDIISVPNFNRHFFADGFDANGNPNRHWYANTVGNPPQMGRTTTIDAPIRPVNVELDDAGGNLRFINGTPLISTVTQFIPAVLNSPVFSNAQYTSSAQPTQFVDAVMRAEFFDSAKPDWHTLLAPRVLPPVTLRVSQSANCPTGPNSAGCNYVFNLNPDGTCCQFVLINADAFANGFFPIVFSDAANNIIKTSDISSFLFPNTLLFGADVTQCCVGGFHEYVFAPVSPEPRLLFTFSSWLTPGLTDDADITGLSHELAEAFNDPFVVTDGVHDLTPWWLAPNGLCGDGMEVGDVTENLPNALFPITLGGFTYHPQNVALMQWFEFESRSDAIGGALSYPDTAVLTSLSAPQKAGCAP